MIYLVDANVLSEPTKPDPSARVMEWLQVNQPVMAVDPIILGEIRIGIYVLDNGARRQRLEEWFEGGVSKLRCLQWEAATGLRWAVLVASLRKSGRSMPIKDSMIAASALLHNLTIATRNVRDFKLAGVKVVNPFGDE